MLLLKESTWKEVLSFLDACEVHGKDIVTVVDPLMQNMDWEDELEGTRYVSYEARNLKQMYLEIMGI